MYAEAKIELNEIDDTVLDAMNQVRARAYKASVTATSDYPAITERSQDKLRTILRTERRMEFAFENLRLYDIWRWRIAEKVLNRPWIGLPKKDQKLQRAYIDNNMWFHGAVPQVDEDGCVDFMWPKAPPTSSTATPTHRFSPSASSWLRRAICGLSRPPRCRS